jgi:N-acetyl-gamma-glutamyl-phosphate reductase
MNIYSPRIAIVGVTGYAGQELDRLLRGHPAIRVGGRFASASAGSESGVEAFSLDRLKDAAPDVVVLATEHDVSLTLVPQLVSEGYRVLDMSGAFRLSDSSLYPQWYGFSHTAPECLSESVYGLAEFAAESVRTAKVVANPGCYATAALLPLLPLFGAGAIDLGSVVVVDGKSGVSGAGRKPKPETHFCAVSENIRAYGVLKHRHTPEMVTHLPGAAFERFIFTPHLIPIRRGILNTIVVRHTDRASVRSILADTYAHAPFVKILTGGRLPEVHDVAWTNNCHIGVVSEGETSVIVSVIDNLGKGAAGQAVQNLNSMLGCEPRAGLL